MKQTGFFARPGADPPPYGGIRQGAATTHGGKRRCFMFRYFRFVALGCQKTATKWLVIPDGPRTGHAVHRRLRMSPRHDHAGRPATGLFRHFRYPLFACPADRLLFVGGDDPGRNAAVRHADAGTMATVGGLVQRQAEPAAGPAAAACGGRRYRSRRPAASPGAAGPVRGCPPGCGAGAGLSGIRLSSFERTCSSIRTGWM